MSTRNLYYVGQGKVYISERDGMGLPVGGWQWLGNAPAMSIAIATEEVNHTESYSGARNQDLNITTTRTVSGTMTLESYDPDTLAVALYGTKLRVDSVAINGEIPVSGEQLRVYRGKTSFFRNSELIDDVVVSGITGTFVEGTDYFIDKGAGSIYVSPDAAEVAATTGTLITIDYSFREYEVVQALQQLNKYYAIRFSGLNTADTNRPVILHGHKANLKPTANLPLIQNDNAVAQLELAFNLMYESNSPVDGEGGQFFYVRQPQPA